MTSEKDYVDFSGAIECRVLETHLNKLPEPGTLCICMTRGERSVRDSIDKTFGKFKRVVIDVDGERHEYDADALIAMLEELEERESCESNYEKLFGTPERAAKTLASLDEMPCKYCLVRDHCGGSCLLYGRDDALLKWLRGDV